MLMSGFVAPVLHIWLTKIFFRDPLKEEITILATKLQKKLKDRQSRSKGICDVRYEIYDEGLNELIRQVAINCPERGNFFFF